MINYYSSHHSYYVAVDCIIFGFDGAGLKLLLIHRGFEPEKGKWSIMGGFVKPDENLDQAAARVLEELTGLRKVYLEQLETFGNPGRDPVDRTISITYFALIDIQKYETQINERFHAKWFPVNKIPKLIFDHTDMVELAKTRLRNKAGLYPILFELMPSKFTLPELQNLYEDVYNKNFDKRNFRRKILSSGLLTKHTEKDKNGSKKGAYYYSLNKRKYASSFQNL